MSKENQNNLDMFLEGLDDEHGRGFGSGDIKEVRVEVKDSNGKTVRDNKFSTYKEVSDYIYDKLKKISQ